VSCREARRTLLATPATAWQVKCRVRAAAAAGARAAAKRAAATRAHQRRQVRTGCHTCAHVRTRAHGCAAGAAFRLVSHTRSANEPALLAADNKALHTVRARCLVVLRGGTNAARHAGDGLAAEAPRSCCRSAGRAAAKPAAAMRAHQCQRVCTGAHTCAHVRTRAHGCAACAAFQTVPHIVLRMSWRSAQLVITRGACIARVAKPFREAG
jgi:hypothetical protein